MRRQAALVAATATLAGAFGGLAASAPASATHEVEGGVITQGLSVPELAEAAPCTPRISGDNTGEWATEGPVVCFAKPAGVTGWTLDFDWSSCTYHWYLVVGWTGGDCLFSEDEGDHVKVWGALGVRDSQFTLTWEHG